MGLGLSKTFIVVVIISIVLAWVSGDVKFGFVVFGTYAVFKIIMNILT